MTRRSRGPKPARTAQPRNASGKQGGTLSAPPKRVETAAPDKPATVAARRHDQRPWRGLQLIAGAVPLARRALSSAGVWALALYGIGAFFVTAAAWRSPATSWAGGCCDPQQTMWFLRWGPYALSHHINPFFTEQLNAPFGVNLMWNASIIAVSIVGSPITLIFGPVIAYNVLTTAAMALSGWCAFLALRRYASGISGPMVGGALYAFSPFETQQALFHLNIALAFIPPLLLLALDELVLRRRRSPLLLGVALGLLAAVQLLVFEEVLLTAVFFAAVMLLTLGAAHWGEVKERTPVVLEALGAAVLTFVVLGAFPLAVQFLGPQRIHGALQNADTFSTDLLNLVVPTQYQRVAPPAATAISTHFTGLDIEATSYVGLLLLMVLTAFVATRWRDLRVRTAAIVTVVALVLSLGPHLHIGGQSTGWPLPWALVAHLPLVESVLPSRLSLYMWLGIAVLLAVAVDELTAARRWRHASPALVAIAVSLAALAPQPFGAWPSDVPTFFQRWSEQRIPESATVLIAPFFRDGAGAAPMLWAAVAGGAVRMPEAYAFIPSADGTPMYGPPANSLSQIMETIQDQGVVVVARGSVREAVAADLQRLQIDDVIVGPMDKHDQMVAFFTDLMGRKPERTEGVEIWRNVQEGGVAPAPS